MLLESSLYAILLTEEPYFQAALQLELIKIYLDFKIYFYNLKTLKTLTSLPWDLLILQYTEQKKFHNVTLIHSI